MMLNTNLQRVIDDRIIKYHQTKPLRKRTRIATPRRIIKTIVSLRLTIINYPPIIRLHCGLKFERSVTRQGRPLL